MNRKDEFNFSENLISLRKNANLSQEELASQLFVTRQTLSRWEKGLSVPDMNHLLVLTQIFEIGLDELVLGIGDGDRGLIKDRISRYLSQDVMDKEWHDNHKWREWQYSPINNGWEFLARYYWVIFALIAMIIWLVRIFTR